jgi:hypothetical protein
MIGLGVFVAAFLICLLARRMAGKSRRPANSDAGHSRAREALPIPFVRPMIVAVILGTAAGLIALAR